MKGITITKRMINNAPTVYIGATLQEWNDPIYIKVAKKEIIYQLDNNEVIDMGYIEADGTIYIN